MTTRTRQRGQALIIRGGRLIDPAQGLDAPGDLWIVDGRIAGLATTALATGASPERAVVIDALGLVVCPGFIDLHVHLRQPGFEEKETIATGTRAAARGGFTTICCMPNTNPVIDTRATVDFVLEKASAEGVVRVLPIAAVTKGQRGEELAEMGELAEAGAVAFSDDGKPVANSRLMRHALEYSRLFGRPIVNHCQDPALSEGAVMNEGVVSTRLGLRGMPAAAEETMVARDIALAELTGGRLHIAHVSTAGSVDLIRRAKERGLVVTVEATPHHLTLTEDWVMGPGQRSRGLTLAAYDTNAKVNPPLRTEADRRALVEGLRDGTIDIIATDHAPHDLVSKLCEFDLAAFGISGLETALGSLMGLVHRGELELPLLIEKLTAAPAGILTSCIPEGLGSLQVGAPADIILIDPEAEWEVEPEAFASKGRNTPLTGTTLKGMVVTTLVGGQLAFSVKELQ